jgi:GT2 family glycosyltransferase
VPELPETFDTSIVLATCSRAALLRGALESLARQSWVKEHRVELVIVDDGSTDETPEVLAEFRARALFPVQILKGPQAGIAAARNVGFHAARGCWIASFDDDQIASPGWLRALRTRADREGVACVGGALRLLFTGESPNPSPGARVRAILGEHLPFPTAQPYSFEHQPATNNALLRRDVFLAMRGFDPAFTEGGEDKDLFCRVRAAGCTLWFEPAATADHVTPPTRLATSNLRWTSLRLGAQDARSALSKSRRTALLLALLRLSATLLRDLPQFLLGGQAQRADARCSFWYTLGLLRALPPLWRKTDIYSPFLRSLNFRARNGERGLPPGNSAASRPAHPVTPV